MKQQECVQCKKAMTLRRKKIVGIGEEIVVINHKFRITMGDFVGRLGHACICEDCIISNEKLHRKIINHASECVYFFKASSKPQTVKIGFACRNNLKRRKIAVQVGCPFEITLIATMPGCLKTEKRIHQLFDKQRVRGEWFGFSLGIRRLIKDCNTSEFLHELYWKNVEQFGHVSANHWLHEVGKRAVYPKDFNTYKEKP